MPAASDIWWRESKKCYYTSIDRKQVRLCKTASESRIKLQKILRGQQTAPSASSGMTFARLADQFLDHSKETNEAETYEVHLYFLQRFKDHVGKRLVSALCEDDLDKWLRKEAKGGGQVNAGGRRGKDPLKPDAKVTERKEGRVREGTPWGESTQARARAVVLAVMNYGVNKLNLPPHPLRHVKPGTVTRRERILTADEKHLVRASVKGVFAELVLALEHTGARPMTEVCSVTAADVDLEKGTWTLAKWKNARKQKGKKRVIFLSQAMKVLTKRLAEQHPEGPLFRCTAGTPWTRQTVTCRFRKLTKKLGLEGVTAYTFRHTAISEALVRGVPVAMVAELYGTSIQTISKSYSHLDQKEDALREAMKRAMGE